MDREAQLINRVRRAFPFTRNGLRVGIGDDAAVPLVPNRGKGMGGHHGRISRECALSAESPPARRSSATRRWLSGATSDIVAMGAGARYFFLTLGLPPACTGAWLEEFLSGMSRAASRFGLILAGGDTAKYPNIVMSLTVMGEISRGKAILRSGARPGDLICVSGERLGEAELGWKIIQCGNCTSKNDGRSC